MEVCILEAMPDTESKLVIDETGLHGRYTVNITSPAHGPASGGSPVSPGGVIECH